MSDYIHPHGKAESLIEFNSKDMLVHDDLLHRFFNHPEVKNRKIVVLQCVGEFRKGKSYFLNYCLKYLYGNYRSLNVPGKGVVDSNGWLGTPDEPLKGFSWRSGENRDTVGILIWNDIFLYETEGCKERIAIVVIDSQGLSDSETNISNNVKIFGLSILMSSKLIFNIRELISENQLQFLNLGGEIAKVPNNNSDTKFQNLTFLIRDWVNWRSHDYGLEGGSRYLANSLEVKINQDPETAAVRSNIKNIFEKFDCVLLPCPGKKVTGAKRTQKVYNGNWGDMDDEFKDELVKFIEELLKPENLIVKKINGADQTGNQYLENLMEYINFFKSEDFPTVKTPHEAMTIKSLLEVVSYCFNEFSDLIKNNRKYADSNRYQRRLILDQYKKITLEKYDVKKKMGSLEQIYQFRKKLEGLCDQFIQKSEEKFEKETTGGIFLSLANNLVSFVVWIVTEIAQILDEILEHIRQIIQLYDNMIKFMNSAGDDLSKTLKRLMT